MLWIALLACSDDDSTPKGSDEVVQPGPPDALGPYVVGTEEFSVDNRSDIAMLTQVWFPASSASDGVYRYDNLVEGGARFDGVPACDEALPVVMFSHGNGGLRYQSFFLTEHLASHGYFVVAPEHTGNTTYDDVLPQHEIAARRPLDVIDAYDAVAELYPDCIDPDAGYAMMGHSFGGYTTLAVSGAELDMDGLAASCAQGIGWLCGLQDILGPGVHDLSDDRVTRAVALAPAAHTTLKGGLADIDVPTFVLGGMTDELTVWQWDVKPIYDDLAISPRYLGGIERTGHYAFTDFCLSGCTDDALPLEEAHRVINTLVTAFLRDDADYLPYDDAPLEVFTSD